MKFNLIIDAGNTLMKTALYEGGLMQDFFSTPYSDLEQLRKSLHNFPELNACIISSVTEDPSKLLDALSIRCKSIILDNSIKLPFSNQYLSPETLGNDRIAGITAAWKLFPFQDVLVIDAGTAITYDIITAEGKYLGGAISPGLNMRYKALHTFTGRLPLLEQTGQPVPLIGNSTITCIHSGVVNGIQQEIDGIIQRYRIEFPDLNIIFTGGDHKYFDKQLKIKTFAAPNLVLDGLNTLLNYNLENQ